MSPEQFANWLAHYGVAEFTKIGVDVPDISATRVAEGQHVDVIVIVRKHQRVTLQYDEEKRYSFIGPEPKAERLTPMQQRILDVLDMENRRKGTWIAAKVCKSKQGGGGFRSALSDLRLRKLIGHEKGKGYFRMSAPGISTA